MHVNTLLRLRTLLNRHRRILGSVCAALAVLLIFGSMSAPAPATGPDHIVAGLPEGFVAVPVTLRSAAIASAVRVGDTIDLVAASETVAPRVIALDATVLDLPSASGFASPTSTVILVSVAAWQGAALAAEHSDQISLVIKTR